MCVAVETQNLASLQFRLKRSEQLNRNALSLFQNKYRIESARLQNWDYGSNALYFVTICTRNSEHFFGKIVSDVMVLSELGKAAGLCWTQIPEHFPFVELDVWTVMPNHVHGIIKINKDEKQTQKEAGVETQDFASLPNMGNLFGPQTKNLGSIIRGYKIGVTKWALQSDIDFGWQQRFHDHIIREEEAYFKIRNYILNNTKNWSKDMFYKV